MTIVELAREYREALEQRGDLEARGARNREIDRLIDAVQKASAIIRDLGVLHVAATKEQALARAKESVDSLLELVVDPMEHLRDIQQTEALNTTVTESVGVMRTEMVKLQREVLGGKHRALAEQVPQLEALGRISPRVDAAAIRQVQNCVSRLDRQRLEHEALSITDVRNALESLDSALAAAERVRAAVGQEIDAQTMQLIERLGPPGIPLRDLTAADEDRIRGGALEESVWVYIPEED